MIGATSIPADRLELIFPAIEHEASVQYRLMEVADSRIAEAIEAGKNLYIRGGPEDDAVLCTEKETFRLRELVTSNMFLVAERDVVKGRALVVGKPTTTIEVSFLSRAPGIDQLAAALKAHPYDGATSEEQAFTGLDQLHCTRLYHVIQASDAEINQFLTEQGALVIKGNFDEN